MILLDGKKSGLAIRESLEGEVASFSRKPKLTVILAGENPASKVYVGMKERASKKAGILGEAIYLPEQTSEEELLSNIDALNNDDSVDAILCQLPLPKHIDERKVIERIASEKDVDCFHPENVGLLASGFPRIKPCTPAGVVALMKAYDIDLEGKHAVVIGRSNIVGKPLTQLLLAENATVTVCHSRTKQLPQIVRSADVVCAAIGKPEFVQGDWIKDGAVVVDVGVNRVDDPTSEKGYKLVGDVAFDEASKHASFITPVPGGIGPMTIAMLLANTVALFRGRGGK